MHDVREPLGSEEMDALRALRSDRDPGPELEERVVEELGNRGAIRSRARRFWLRPVAAIAILALGFGSGWLARNPSTTPATPASPSFMLLLHDDEQFESSDLHAAEYGRWARDMAERGRYVTGAELYGTARSLPESPDSSSPGALLGYFVIEAKDLDEAVRVARTSPHLRYGGTIVIRPLR